MSTPLRILCLAAVLIMPTPIGAAGGQQAERAVRHLSHSTARLARTRFAQKTFTAYRGKSLTLSVRPAAGVIVLRKGLSSKGFFLDKKGQLPKAQAAELTRALRTDRRATSDAILRGLLRSSNEMKQHERRLATQLPLITTLLTKAAGVRGDADRVIWEGRRGSITYRPQAKVLVGSSGLSSHGFFLAETARGLEVRSDSLEGLQSFLLESR